MFRGRSPPTAPASWPSSRRAHHRPPPTAPADHERLARASLSRAGNPENGRKVFFNAEKSLCVKCHRVGEQGERVGPDLTGLGGRFSKAYIIESILEPGRTIAPSYESTR